MVSGRFGGDGALHLGASAGAAAPFAEVDRVELPETERRHVPSSVTGTSRSLSRPAAASSRTQWDLDAVADQATTTISASARACSISRSNSAPPVIRRSHRDLVAGSLQRSGEIARPRLIFARIAEK